MKRAHWLNFALLFVALAFAVEGWLWFRFVENVTSARSGLLAIRGELDLSALRSSESQILDIQGRLHASTKNLASAQHHLDRDPLFTVATYLPGLGRQAKGLRAIIASARSASLTGLAASSVLLDYSRIQGEPSKTSVQQGLAFLQSEKAQMADVRRGLDATTARRSTIPDRLVAPLATGTSQLDDALGKLDSLVSGYEQAQTLLPAVLGLQGPRRYLVLPQNDTELFPSGGLISNYGLAVFDQGKMTDIQFEYFVNLYDRWQQKTGGEYVEPPPGLKNHLLRDISWGLGEAGWYPDFPTTARLAGSFLQKGGGPATDGVIAIDLQFVEALLRVVGPITLPEYSVTVTADNLADVTLQNTRDELSQPGAPGKAFLSPLARELLNRVFSSSREQWMDLLNLLNRMAMERHLQLYFNDRDLESANTDYGFDGSLKQTNGDFLMLADASVNSTKLNLILEQSYAVDLTLSGDSVTTKVMYQVTNPFPTWRQGRDPKLVEALMLNGVYGSYLRLYASPRAQFGDWKLDGKSAGIEQFGVELGKVVMGRFFPVLPGKTVTGEVDYFTPATVSTNQDGKRHYKLLIQKEPGTRAIPLGLTVNLPANAGAVTVRLDGKVVDTRTPIKTDLRIDRMIKIDFSLP